MQESKIYVNFDYYNQERSWYISSKNYPISKVFREIGLADELGSGMKNTYKYSRLYSGGDPESIEGDTFRIIIPLSAIAVGKVGPEKALRISTHDINGWLLEEILGFCKEPRSKQEIMDHLGYKEQRTFTRRYLRPLLDKGYLQMTLPDKPQSHYQRYVTSSEAFASESLS